MTSYNSSTKGGLEFFKTPDLLGECLLFNFNNMVLFEMLVNFQIKNHNTH